MGWPGSTRKPQPRFCSMTPLFGAESEEPKLKKRELMKETVLRALSTTVR